MSSQNSVDADVFVKALKDQRNAALDVVALRDGEIAALRAALVAAKAELKAEIERSKNDHSSPA